MSNTYTAAVELLESQKRDQMNWISAQEKNLTALREQLASNEQRLAESKQALLDVDAALALLKAGA